MAWPHDMSQHCPIKVKPLHALRPKTYRSLCQKRSHHNSVYSKHAFSTRPVECDRLGLPYMPLCICNVARDSITYMEVPHTHTHTHARASHTHRTGSACVSGRLLACLDARLLVCLIVCSFVCSLARLLVRSLVCVCVCVCVCVHVCLCAVLSAGLLAR